MLRVKFYIFFFILNSICGSEFEYIYDSICESIFLNFSRLFYFILSEEDKSQINEGVQNLRYLIGFSKKPYVYIIMRLFSNKEEFNIWKEKSLIIKKTLEDKNFNAKTTAYLFLINKDGRVKKLNDLKEWLQKIVEFEENIILFFRVIFGSCFVLFTIIGLYIYRKINLESQNKWKKQILWIGLISFSCFSLVMYKILMRKLFLEQSLNI